MGKRCVNVWDRLMRSGLWSFPTTSMWTKQRGWDCAFNLSPWPCGVCQTQRKNNLYKVRKWILYQREKENLKNKKVNTDIQWKPAGSKALAQPFPYTHIPLFTKLPFIPSHLFLHTWDLPSKWIPYPLYSLSHPKCKTPLNFLFCRPKYLLHECQSVTYTFLTQCFALARHKWWHKWICVHWILWKGRHMFNLTHYTCILVKMVIEESYFF